MKKSVNLFLAVMLLVAVIAILWTHVSKRGLGGQEHLSDFPSHVGEDMPEPQQDYGLLSDTLPNRVETTVNVEAFHFELLEDASEIMEDKSKDVAGEVEEIQDKQEYTTTDVLVDQSKGNESQEGRAVIQDDQAIAIAQKVIRDRGRVYDEKGEIRVDRLEGKIRVVFPVNKETPQGTRYRGPDYAAEVYIDAESGEVLKVRRGG